MSPDWISRSDVFGFGWGAEGSSFEIRIEVDGGNILIPLHGLMRSIQRLI